MKRRIIPPEELHRRIAELDRIKARRRLTDQEAAEADNLARRAYHRAWMADLRAQEQRLKEAGL